MQDYTRLQAASDYQKAAYFLDPANCPKGYDHRDVKATYSVILCRAMSRLSSSRP
jgi:hypothetical protein